jgi:hypothetical protein
MVDSAIRLITSTAEKNKLAECIGWCIGESKERTRKGPDSYFIRTKWKHPQFEHTVSLIGEVKTRNTVPGSVAAVIFKACEAKGWKEIEL